MKFAALFALIALISAVSFAGCAADAYRSACSSCQFDANGKMNQACYASYQGSGTACTTGKYPITSAKYSAGNCSQVDECISQLSSCTAQYKSGNDSADCQEGSLSVCFSAADSCMQSAAARCEGVQSPCGTTAMILFAGVAGFALYVRRN